MLRLLIIKKAVKINKYLSEQIILKSIGGLNGLNTGKDKGAKFLINLRIYK